MTRLFELVRSAHPGCLDCPVNGHLKDLRDLRPTVPIVAGFHDEACALGVCLTHLILEISNRNKILAHITRFTASFDAVVRNVRRRHARNVMERGSSLDEVAFPGAGRGWVGVLLDDGQSWFHARPPRLRAGVLAGSNLEVDRHSDVEERSFFVVESVDEVARRRALDTAAGDCIIAASWICVQVFPASRASSMRESRSAIASARRASIPATFFAAARTFLRITSSIPSTIGGVVVHRYPSQDQYYAGCSAKHYTGCSVGGMDIKPGHEVTYTGTSWLGHAVEHTHGHGFVLDVHNDHASVLYGSSVLIVPTSDLAFYRDRLQVAWEAQTVKETER